MSCHGWHPHSALRVNAAVVLTWLSLGFKLCVCVCVCVCVCARAFSGFVFCFAFLGGGGEEVERVSSYDSGA